MLNEPAAEPAHLPDAIQAQQQRAYYQAKQQLELLALYLTLPDQPEEFTGDVKSQLAGLAKFFQPNGKG